MKTLNDYIIEWRANSDNISSIKKSQYFIYKIDKKCIIKIFDNDWSQLKNYKDKVYINGKQITVGSDGWTMNEYEPGIYEIEIKDIDDVKDCTYMFYYCTNLIEVPLFNTSNVENMYSMFKFCENLENVPLFDISNVETISEMFYDCSALNNETKKAWSKVYDFVQHKKK